MQDSEKIQTPPHSIELEEAVLGALLCEKEAYYTVADILHKDCFYKSANQLIYSAIDELGGRNEPVDTFTVAEKLTKNGNLEQAGGVVYLAYLTSKVSSAAHLEYHAQIILQKQIAREVIKLSGELQTMAFDQNKDVSDILEFAEKGLTHITTGTSVQDSSSMLEALESTVNYISDIHKLASQGKSTAIQTGFPTLDRLLYGGWQKTDFVIIGGRPSMGKSQFALHFTKMAATQGKSTLFVSIEMTMVQLVLRMIVEDEKVNMYNLKSGHLTDEEWAYINRKIGELEKYNIHISDGANARNLNNIKSLARKLKRKNQLDMIIIDYLGLIKTGLKFGTRDLEIGYITSELKNLQKELQVPLILLSQLSRPMKGHTVQEPKLTDLRESGNIEQDADIVIFPHRSVYYNPDAVDENGNSLKNKGGLIVAKHREGVKDEVVMFEHNDTFKKIWEYRNSPNYDYKNFYEKEKPEEPF